MYGHLAARICAKCKRYDQNTVMSPKTKVFICGSCSLEEDPPRMTVTGNLETTVLFWPLHNQLFDYTDVTILCNCGWFVRRKIYTSNSCKSNIHTLIYDLEFYGSVVCPAVKYDRWPMSWNVCNRALCELRNHTIAAYYT